MKKPEKQMRLTYRPLHLIRPLPGNAKLHDLEEIKRSIRDHGFIDPIGINPATMHDLDGNGRLQALKMMFADGEPPPRNIQFDADGWGEPCWLAPTVDVECADEDEEKILALRLNRTHDKGGYDKAAVLAVLELAEGQGRLDQTGYDKHAFEHLKQVVEHSNPDNLDDFFAPSDKGDDKPGKEKIVLEYEPAIAAAVKAALLQHGKTPEDAVVALLGL